LSIGYESEPIRKETHTKKNTHTQLDIIASLDD